MGELSALSEEFVPVVCQAPSAASSFAFAQYPPSIFQSSQDPNVPHLIAALALGKKMGGCAALLPPSPCRSHSIPAELLFRVQMTCEWNGDTFSCSNVRRWTRSIHVFQGVPASECLRSGRTASRRRFRSENTACQSQRAPSDP